MLQASELFKLSYFFQYLIHKLFEMIRYDALLLNNSAKSIAVKISLILTNHGIIVA